MLTSKSRRNVIAAAVVVLLAVFLAMASRWNQQKQSTPRELSNTVEGLIGKAAQYNGIAQQDNNPLFALLHANYGLAYWTVARSLASDESIAQLTGYDPRLLGQQLEQSMQNAMNSLQRAMPSPTPSTMPLPSPAATELANPLIPMATRAVPMPINATDRMQPMAPPPWSLPQGYSPV